VCGSRPFGGEKREIEMKHSSTYGLRILGGAMVALLVSWNAPAFAHGGEGDDDDQGEHAGHHDPGDDDDQGEDEHEHPGKPPEHPKPPGGSACRNVAKDAFLACLNDAGSSFWLSVAQCDNAPPAPKPMAMPMKAKRHSKPPHPPGGACKQTASSDLRDATSECKDQQGARQDVCKLLGGGPYNPVIDPANFSTTIDNPFNPLVPGTTFVFEGMTADGLEHDEVTVTSNTRVIMGVTCVAVQDTVTLAGQVTEDTTDWFAQDSAGNVWYFGEDSRQFTDGFLSGTEGSFVAGVDGALPGIIMEAHPAVGDAYRQEFSIGIAEDIAQVVATDAAVSVPFVSSPTSLETLESSPLEPGATEHKFYVQDIGVVLTVDDQTGDRSELISVTKPAAP